MCDYSLQDVASRPAAVGDKLVSTRFGITRGFSAPGAPDVAVCLRPGTEVAFDRDVELDDFLGYARRVLPARVARFRQIDKHEPHVHHDALEFPDGEIVLVTRLVEGQHATVLQLPAEPRTADEIEEQKRLPIVA